MFLSQFSIRSLLFKTIPFMVIGLLLSNCDHNKHPSSSNKSTQIATVTTQTLSTTLYFNGTIKPLEASNVPSPTEGVVVEKAFSYGEPVKKNQLLLKLNSKELLQNYNTALTSYLQAKDKLTRSKSKALNDKKLYDLGIISKNEYEDSQSTLNVDNMSYLQSLHALENLTFTSQSTIKDLEKLTIKDIEKIDKALSVKNALVPVTAPTNGIVLLPEDKNGTPGDPIKVGSQIKFGEILLNISDLNGISATISVSEINIQKLKIGQKVTITGDAFPNKTLHGEVDHIDAQASSAANSSGSLPTFTATVAVKQLTPEERKLIRVGMSAKITVAIEHPNVMLIPIDAIYEKNGQSMVKKLVNKKTVETPVLTGETTFNDVEIRSGLSVGDKIIYTPGDQVIVKKPKEKN